MIGNLNAAIRKCIKFNYILVLNGITFTFYYYKKCNVSFNNSIFNFPINYTLTEPLCSEVDEPELKCINNNGLDDKINKETFILTDDIIKKIHNEIDSYDVVLFMKGNARKPYCKYSRYALELLMASNFDTIRTVNVLDDQDLRNGLKVYSNYPYYPQLYIKGKFIGGLDKIIELYNNNKLKLLLDE